jgi:hypothetical protein
MPSADPAQLVADTVRERPGLTTRALHAGTAAELPTGVTVTLALELARRAGLIYSRGPRGDRQRHYPVPAPRSGHPPEGDEALARLWREVDDHSEPLNPAEQLALFTFGEGG